MANPRSRAVVEAWVRAYNAGDVDALVELYHVDAVNDQVADRALEGREAIRGLLRREFQASEMSCRVEQILVDGEWAVLEWRDGLGLRGCAIFRVVGGRIAFQRSYRDKLSFLRLHGLPLARDPRVEEPRAEEPR